jgi:hypothetical protein
MFSSLFDDQDDAELLRRELAQQEAEDAELRSILTNKDIPQAEINSIIASAMCRIRIAQVYQNHNSTLIAKRIRRLNINMFVVTVLLVANILLGQQLSLQAIVSEIAKFLLH